jgi:hypothetical protein
MSLWAVLHYIKVYPQARNSQLHEGHVNLFRAKMYPSQYIWPRIDYLSRCINDVSLAWNERLNARNSLPFSFQQGVHITGSVDSFDVQTRRPKNAAHSRMGYSGKHHHHVFKVILYMFVYYCLICF